MPSVVFFGQRSVMGMVGWLSPLIVLAQPPAGDPAPASGKDAVQVQRWIEQLASDQYVERELATLRLSEQGVEVVPQLVQAVDGGDLERIERIVDLLKRMTLQEEPKDPPIGWDALQQIAVKSSGVAAGRARGAMETIRQRRNRDALSMLRREEVRIGISDVVLAASQINGNSVHIPEDWEGDFASLAWLRWLQGIEYAAVEGRRVNRAMLAEVARMPDLHNLLIANADLAAEDLAPLKRIARIDMLEIRYTPITDDAIALLKKLPIRQSLILNATDITPQAVEELRTALPAVRIIYKRGGFLGVTCDPWAPRCVVTQVVANGAAERAGLRSGDTIMQINDTPVQRFADLQEAIYGLAAGEKVTLKIVRQGEPQEIEATLGNLQSVE